MFEGSVEYFEKTQQLLWYSALADKFIAFIDLKSQDEALEISCGPGGLTRKIAARAQSAVGIDMSAEMIASARSHPKGKRMKNLKYEVGDILATPFHDHSFDVVLANAVLYLLEAPIDALREMARVTRPLGRVALLNPSIEMRPERVRMYAASQGLTGFAFEMLYGWLTAAQANHRFTIADTERLLRKAGLTNIVVSEALDHMVLMGIGTKPC